MGQTIIVAAEVAMAVLTLGVLIANWISISRFGESLRLTRESLRTANRAADESWRVAQGQMLLDANRDFFYQEPHKTIIRRLEMGEPLRHSEPTVPRVPDCDLDDHIGFLDTIGTFTRAGILNAPLVWEVFSHYVDAAHEDEDIAEYLKEVRSEPDSAGLFSDFEWL